MNESQREQRRETAVPARRTFLKHFSLLIAGAAGAQLFLPSNASAQDARVAQDIAVLNYALHLSAWKPTSISRACSALGPRLLRQGLATRSEKSGRASHPSAA